MGAPTMVRIYYSSGVYVFRLDRFLENLRRSGAYRDSITAIGREGFNLAVHVGGKNVR